MLERVAVLTASPQPQGDCAMEVQLLTALAEAPSPAQFL